MLDWNPALYRRYEDERTRPAQELLARVPLAGATRVVDLGCGPGNSTELLIARYPGAEVTALDSSPDMLEAARERVPQIRIEHVDIERWDDEGPYDVILANPPYVTDAAMAALPPEHQAEPRIAHAGGPDGLDIVRRILAKAREHLNPGGSVVVEIGTGREVIETEFPRLPFLWLDTEDSEGEVFALPASALTKEIGP